MSELEPTSPDTPAPVPAPVPDAPAAAPAATGDGGGGGGLQKAGAAAAGAASAAGTAIAATGAVLGMAVRYGIVIAQLAAAGAKLRGLSEQVRSTYEYVEGCAGSVDDLADQMSGLRVDRDTVSEHHEAASVMRSVLADAEAMAAATEDLASLFDQAAAEHEADYGPVTQAFQSMSVDPAESEFYSNR
ncbi:hypothetical protein [Streptomyces sp. NPDC091217]|uniref:hypothetical protein n=1 Tax=Streptomyces sp. NPDC091217 TaxID=3365975 RepID=UPI003806D237